jgi:hypothetical protein
MEKELCQYLELQEHYCLPVECKEKAGFDLDGFLCCQKHKNIMITVNPMLEKKTFPIVRSSRNNLHLIISNT